jgi:hypothetical protein
MHELHDLLRLHFGRLITEALTPPLKRCDGHLVLCAKAKTLAFATMDVKKKYELEAALATEAQAISSGQLKEENPLDLSDDFRLFCEACRRGDLKVCQEMISQGVNLNARDKYDYTPLILVTSWTLFIPSIFGLICSRLACAATTRLYGCCLRMARSVSGTPFRANDACTMRSTTEYEIFSCLTTMQSRRTLCSRLRPILPRS